MTNPYDLFNLNINDIKDENFLKKLRNVYHDWVLLVHPDKGGNIEEMKIIQSAYEFIKEDHKNYEEFYKNKCDDTIPTYAEIYNEINNLIIPLFSNMDLVDSSDKIPMTFEYGYNNVFSEIKDNKIYKFDNDNIGIYNLDINNIYKTRIDDFSIYDKNMNDILIAYKNIEILDEFKDKTPVNFQEYEQELNKTFEIKSKSYDEILLEREEKM